jgi:hypothetical protein
MPQIVADAPVLACFRGWKSGNLNNLVLIRMCLARGTRERFALQR